MTRRDFLKLSPLGITYAATMLYGVGYRDLTSVRPRAFPKSLYASSVRRNILFIVVDDLRPDLGCYGHTMIRSPNIDALAKNGTLFTRAYCQIAVCGPSRASVLSGYRPDTSGIYSNLTPLRSVVPDVVSLPQIFRENGYKTIALGKVYHHRREDTLGWDVEVRDIPQTSALRPSSIEDTNTHSVEAEDVPDDAYHDGALTDLAISTLKKLRETPFFLAVGYKKPHLPFQAPLKYWNVYDRDKIPIPSRNQPNGAPSQAFSDWAELRRYDDIPASGDLDDAKTLELIHGYMACVTYVDTQIGRLLAELDRLDLRENTTIILWGDNGYKLGEYGDWSKHTNFEFDTLCPMIVCDPAYQQSATCEALVELVDIYPTLVDIAGLALPSHCDGTSFKALLADPSIPWKAAALSQFRRNPTLMGHSVRTAKWRYTEWRETPAQNLKASELYDHSESALATNNVAYEAENAGVVETFQRSLAIYRESNEFVYPPLTLYLPVA